MMNGHTSHQENDERSGTQMDVYIVDKSVFECMRPIEGCKSHFMKVKERINKRK